MLVCKFVSRFYLLLLLFNSILSLFFFPLERTIKFWCVRSQWKSHALWQQNEASNEQYKKRMRTNANERAHTKFARIQTRTHTYTHTQTMIRAGRMMHSQLQLRAAERERVSESGRGHNICSKIPKNFGIFSKQPWHKKGARWQLSNNYKFNTHFYLLLTLK